MSPNHLTEFEQEEYLLDQRTPQMLRHLAECASCWEAVARLEQTLGLFRSTAHELSAQSLAGRPQLDLHGAGRWMPTPTLRWGFVVLLPLLLMVLALLPGRLATPKPSQPAVSISDDALLDQVDEQLSATVPSSMESLTHLVSTNSNSAGESGLPATEVRSGRIVQSN